MMESLRTTLIALKQELASLLMAGDPPIYMQLLYLTAAFIVLKLIHRNYVKAGAAKVWRIDLLSMIYLFLVFAILTGWMESFFDLISGARFRGRKWIA